MTEENPNLVTGSRCAACDKILEDEELDIRGVITGQPLGLCRYCGNVANNAVGKRWKEKALIDG